MTIDVQGMQDFEPNPDIAHNQDGHLFTSQSKCTTCGGRSIPSIRNIEIAVSLGRSVNNLQFTKCLPSLQLYTCQSSAGRYTCICAFVLCRSLKRRLFQHALSKNDHQQDISCCQGAKTALTTSRGSRLPCFESKSGTGLSIQRLATPQI